MMSIRYNSSQESGRELIELQQTTHNHDMDLEKAASAQLQNNVVRDFAWQSFNVTVKDRKTKKPRNILHDASGLVQAGEMLAIMGPSGSGKTTLLNAIAHRPASAGANTTGEILANGKPVNLEKLRQLSSYVEQDDAMIGSLTVKETMSFAARLSLPSSTSRADRIQKVQDLIASFGLREQSDTIVGTPIRKGLSGGQIKRLGVASRLVTDPKIIFLDEPTSGLDSTLSFEVMNYIKDIAKRHKLIVIASIHQPSTSTFKLFDKVCLLAKGETCYFGSLESASPYFANCGYPMPRDTNPAEFYLDLVNTDLGKEEVIARRNDIAEKWAASPNANALNKTIEASTMAAGSTMDLADIHIDKPSLTTIPIVLLHRSWIKSYRDIVAYGMRMIMYLGLAILMGTVFLRFHSHQTYIQPYINALFFGGAFMSFMAVAYVPAFLEDLQTFKKERANGLVGPLGFSIANFLIGLPFLFLIALLFSVVAYFLTDFRSSASAFFIFTMWLFLDLVAAESLVVLVSVTFPVFVIALAVTAFANGLWMCVDGFLVPMNILNVFWKYVFHFIDYQAYVFQGMMLNQFKGSTYTCDKLSNGQYQCMFPSPLNSEGKIPGTAVLEYFQIGHANYDTGKWVGITIGIIFGYRVLAYLMLRLR